MQQFNFIAERALDKAMVDTGAKHDAAVIVMDPKLVKFSPWQNRPSYESNNYNQSGEEGFQKYCRYLTYTNQVLPLSPICCVRSPCGRQMETRHR